MATVKNSPIAFRFDQEVKRALTLISEREGRSKANMMEWLIRKHCEREGLGWPIEPSGLPGDESPIRVARASKTAPKAKTSRTTAVAKPAKRVSKTTKTD